MRRASGRAPGDMKTTGTFLAERYGNSLYTIGMTAFTGEEGFAVGGPASPIAPAPDGSLEARLHGLGLSKRLCEFARARPARHLPIRAHSKVRKPTPSPISAASMMVSFLLTI